MSTEPRSFIESMMSHVGVPEPPTPTPFEFQPTDTNGSRDELIRVFLRHHEDVAHLAPHLLMLLDIGMRAERIINARKAWTILKDHGADSLAQKVYDAVMRGHK